MNHASTLHQISKENRKKTFGLNLSTILTLLFFGSAVMPMLAQHQSDIALILQDQWERYELKQNCFAADSRHILAHVRTAEGNDAILFDLYEGDQTKRGSFKSNEFLSPVGLLPDNSIVGVTNEYDAQNRIYIAVPLRYDFNTDKVEALDSIRNYQLGSFYSPEGYLPLFNSNTSGVELYNVADRTVRSFNTPLSMQANAALGFSPDASRVFVAGAGVIRVGNIQTGNIIFDEFHMALYSTGNHFEMTPDNRSIVFTGYSDNTLYVVDLETGIRERRIVSTFIARSSYGNGFSISPDGKHVAAVWSDGITIFDLRTGTALRGMKGYDGILTNIFYSPDGKYLATGTADGSIIIWNAPQLPGSTTTSVPGTGAPVATLDCSATVRSGSDQALFQLSLPATESARLEIVNMMGERMIVPVDNLLEEGSHQVDVDIQNLRSGLYLYRLTAGGEMVTGRFLLQR